MNREEKRDTYAVKILLLLLLLSTGGNSICDSFVSRSAITFSTEALLFWEMKIKKKKTMNDYGREKSIGI